MNNLPFLEKDKVCRWEVRAILKAFRNRNSKTTEKALKKPALNSIKQINEMRYNSRLFGPWVSSFALQCAGQKVLLWVKGHLIGCKIGHRNILRKILTMQKGASRCFNWEEYKLLGSPQFLFRRLARPQLF